MDKPMRDEDVGEVVRIRLWNCRNAIAVLSEFFTAERVLQRWAVLAACEPVGFEVIFVGGQVVRGSHVFYRGGRRRVMLSTHVKKLLGAGPAPAMPQPAPHAGA